MWEVNSRTYRNQLGQEAVLSFRPTESSDWKYQDQTYKFIYEVKLETKWGVRHFWYCFPESAFAQPAMCELYLRSPTLAFEPLEVYITSDISRGLSFGAIIPHITSSVLVFGRMS